MHWQKECIPFSFRDLWEECWAFYRASILESRAKAPFEPIERLRRRDSCWRLEGRAWGNWLACTPQFELLAAEAKTGPGVAYLGPLEVVAKPQGNPFGQSQFNKKLVNSKKMCAYGYNLAINPTEEKLGKLLQIANRADWPLSSLWCFRTCTSEVVS